MPVTRIAVHQVARKAGHSGLAKHRDIPNVLVDVAIRGMEFGIAGKPEIGFEILEEIISGNEIVGEGQTGAA